MTDKRDRGALADQLVNPKILRKHAILWGQSKEKVAVSQFEEISGIRIRPCGFCISNSHIFIAASPDGLICDATVLEIKCPYSIRNKKITAENLHYITEVEGKLHLKKTCQYYYQVQTQMLVTERRYCDFVAWTECDIQRLSVHRNDEIIDNLIILRATEFYKKYMIPALIKKYIPNN